MSMLEGEGGPLSAEERATVISAFLEMRGERGASEQEIVTILEWAVGVRVGEAMLEGVLEGTVVLNLEPGETEPRFWRKGAVA